MPYYIRIRGRAFGPFDEDQLTEMKVKGKLGKTTEISSNKADWQPAESLDLLFPQPPSGGSTFEQSNSVYDLQSLSGQPKEPADWYYSVNGTEGYGPVTATTVEQMLRSGQLTGNSYVWQQGQNARFIKSELRFFSSVDGSPKPAPIANPGDMVNLGGEITGTSEQVDIGKILHHMAASLGWLMFQKIIFLIGMIVQGLNLLLGGGYSIAYAIGKDNATVLFVTLLFLVFSTGLYALQFKTFLCFWKFHADLYQTVATGRASDLIQANQSQTLFWKWLGITILTLLSIFLIVAIVMAINMGYILGILETIFLPRSSSPSLL